MDYTGYVPDRFKLYIFDLDGTLVDSLADLASSVNETLLRSGFPAVDAETVKRSVGNGARNLLLRCFAESASACGRAAPDSAFVDGVMPGYRAYYEAHSTEQTRLYPGMREWLDYLSSRGRRMAVLSNKPVSSSIAILRTLDAERYFAVIGGPETTGTLKPDPAGVSLVLSCMGGKARDSVFVGDSDVDMLTARNSGIFACGITGGLGDEVSLRASKPDIIIERE